MSDLPETIVSFCSGIGGLERGLEAATGARTVAQVEIDPDAVRVLREHWPDTPRWSDIRHLDGVPSADLLCAGYPCQPFSHAGLRKGTDDPRHLWPAVAAGIDVLAPRWVVLENVRGHLSLGFGRVLGDLADLGFDAEWQVFRSSDIGAAHGRARVFIVGRRQGPSDPDGVAGASAGSQRARHGPGGGLAPIGTDRRRGGGHAADAHVESGGPVDQRAGGRPEPRRGDRAAPPHPDRGAGELRRGPGVVDGPQGPDDRARLQRERGGDTARAGGPDGSRGDPRPAAPDADGDGRCRVAPSDGPDRRVDIERGRDPHGHRMAGRQRGTARAAPPDPDDMGRQEHRRAGTARPAHPAHDRGRGPGDECDACAHLGWLHSPDGACSGCGGPCPPAPPNWGPYTAAVQRWEALHGPAPHPVVDGRLSPRFAEWQMGFPDRWVSGVGGLARTDMLRVIGNAVQPQVATLAWSVLAPRLDQPAPG